MEDLIKEFRITVSNILLYPPDSTLIKLSLERCAAVLNKVVEKGKTLTISESEGTFLVNGEPIELSGGIFFDSIISLKIKSIIFKPGFTYDELHTFLYALAYKHKPESSPHIEISEKMYIPVDKKAMGIEGGTELNEKIITITNELSTLIERIEDKATRDKIRLEVAKILGLEVKIEKPLPME